ncbi:MAG: hypothetical protein ACOYXT_00245, partial [Bacteroidota bacterium]
MPKPYKFGPIPCLLIGLFLLAAHSSIAQCSFTNLNSSYCVDDAAFTLTGGTNYYGNGVSGTTFDPAAAGVGTHQLITTNGVASSYLTYVNSFGTFSPEAGSGTSLVLTDDSQALAIPIGFTFNFFGNNYTTTNVGSNGFITFDDGTQAQFAATTPSNQAIRSGTDPDNLIAAVWDDLNPEDGGTIEYFTTGSAPFRKFIINYTGIPHFSSSPPSPFSVTFQIQLHETTNIIEIHSTQVQSDGGTLTQGIEDYAASIGYSIAGRNNVSWTATNDYVAFVPTCLEFKTVTVNALPTDLNVTPGATTICSGSTTNVTIESSQAGVQYQLQNDSDSSPLSGFFSGTGANLVVTSNALTSNTTIKVYARNTTTLCDRDLTDKVTVTVDQTPTASAAGPDQNICGTSATLAANTPVIGSGTWSIVSGAGGSFVLNTDPATTFNGV